MYNNSHLSQYPYYQQYQQQPQYGMMSSYQPRQTQAQEIQPQVMPTSLGANYIKGRPVVSIDEARASQIDLDGSLFVFPDLGNKKIYTKQINLDGTAAFNVFTLTEETKPATQPLPEIPNYVTREELNSILEQFKTSLEQASSVPEKMKFDL